VVEDSGVRSLYISHNGMLEGLGRSQVLSYLRGLARRGMTIDLLSYELADASRDAIDELRGSLEGSGVHWTPLVRHRDTRLVVKVQESAYGALRALGKALAHRPDIVHGRSYLPTAVADVVATIVPRARLLFDCRGLLGDENVDAGHWTNDRLEYRLVKQYERRAFRRAEGVVFLTHALERWAREHDWVTARTEVAVIPCCVDLDEFRFDADARARVRAELGIAERLVLVYSGSLGSWYREAEIAQLAGIAKKRAGRPIAFLLLTPSPPAELTRMLRAEGLADDEIVVRKLRPSQMPAYLSAGDLGISFIKSCFSKKASSPTKVAEYLACGLPVVLNGDIGDQADLAAERETCVVVSRFDEEGALEAAVDRGLALASRPLAQRVAEGRAVADARFGLERVGVTRYAALYERLLRSR